MIILVDEGGWSVENKNKTGVFDLGAFIYHLRNAVVPLSRWVRNDSVDADG